MEYQTKVNPEIVLDGNDNRTEEIIPELKVQFRSLDNLHFKKVQSSTDVAEIVRKIIPENTIELQEQMVILYLDRSNKVKGYYRHSIGSIVGTIVDIRIILSAALKSLSVGMIMAHNHPSGNTKPSEQDKTLTRNIKEACKYMEISFLDHVIVTKDSYYSFADEGLLGIQDDKSLKNSLKQDTRSAPKKIKSSKKGEEKEIKNNGPKKVSHISEDVKFIKRFVALHNKRKKPAHILALLKSLQRSISMKLITKDSPFVTEVRRMQDKLVSFYNTIKKEQLMKIDNKDLPRLVAIAGGEKVYPSINFIKRFIGFQGKPLDEKRMKNFIVQLEKAAKNQKIKKEDPYVDKLNFIYNYLKIYYKKGKKVEISKTDLNGLNGIVEECTCHSRELGKIYDTSGKRVRRCKSKRYSDAIRGACSYNGEVENLGKIYDTKGKKVRRCKSKKYSDAKKGACSYNGGVGDLGKIYNTKGKLIRRCKSKKYSDAGKGACAYNKGLEGIMTAEQIANQHFELLPFRGQWEELIGKPEKNFSMMLHGEPGGGKTVFLMKFVKYLSGFGNVLYVSSEEFGSVTLQEKVKKYLTPFPTNLHFISRLSDFDLSNYSFVIFDSINDLGMNLELYKELKKINPKTAFILVLQHTKDGQFKGGKEWEHEVQIAGEVIGGVINIYKNRYGVYGMLNFFEQDSITQ